MEHILFVVANQLSFFEVLMFRRTSKQIHDLFGSNEYWSFRIFPLSYLVVHDDPLVNYAWTILTDKVSGREDKSPCHRLSHRDCRQATIFLSKVPNLLFPGLEVVIGMKDFLLRSVEQNSLDFINYAVSTGSTEAMIHEAIKLAIDLDHCVNDEVSTSQYRQLVETLHMKFPDCWIYHASYGSRDETPSSYNIMNFTINLIKYGNYVIKRHKYDEIWYLCGLAERYMLLNKMSTFKPKGINQEKEFIEILDQAPLTYEYSLGSEFSLFHKLEKLGEHLGRCSEDMMAAYIEHTETDEQVSSLIQSLVEADNIDLLTILVQEYLWEPPIAPGILCIKSRRVFDLVKDMVFQGEKSKFNRLLDGIISGRNYELFYRFLDSEDFDLYDPQMYHTDQSPLIMRLELQDRRLLLNQS